jgi:pyrimidine deaminase RibD-like protein
VTQQAMQQVLQPGQKKSPMSTDKKYMYRCIELARLGASYTAPNPMVGAVLVYEDRIIGEGYHEQYGNRMQK